MPKKDYYNILGVPQTATDDDIKKAYRKLAMQFHPDKNPGKEKWANEKFKEINEAYGVLGNPDKRKQYDQFGTTGDASDVFNSHTTQTTFEDLMKDFGGAGLGVDFMDSIFGNFTKPRGFSSISTLLTAAAESFLPRLKMKTWKKPTIHSNRSVRLLKVSIMKSPSRANRHCAAWKRPYRNSKRLRVKIPARIRSGTRIRLRNARLTTDGFPGDIYIIVKVK